MPAGEILFYSELNLNQYSVGSPCRTICTICGSPPCPGLNLIHYTSSASNGIPRFQLDMADRADFQAAVVQPNIPAHHVF